MLRSRGFACVTAADFVVRSAYQMGKTPLLPIFAAALGAGDALLGFIVAVSTLTGMVLKPFVGILSDRWGRRTWLLAGTAFFVGMPFLYRLVQSPEQLVALRVVHGLATAIYGPVTLAYVAELSQRRRAERLGWFSLARSAGYVVGPAAAGLLLLLMDPVSVFTLVGILSCVAFLPVLLLPETAPTRELRTTPLVRRAMQALRADGRTPAVWLAGGLHAKVYFALYAAKAFLPLHALASGVSPALVGAFFAVQEGVHIVLNPIGGRIGDRSGHLRSVAVGMALIGAALILLPWAGTGAALMAPAVLMGVAQALVLPASVALVADRVDERNLGLGMGLVGTLKNAGKVAGPALVGGLIFWLDFTATFRLLGTIFALGAVAVWASAYLSQRRQQEAPASGPAFHPEMEGLAD